MKLEFEKVEPEALKLIPASMALEYGVVPIKVADETLTLAVARQLDLQTQELLAFRSGCSIETVVIDAGDLKAALARFYGDAQRTGRTATGDLQRVGGSRLEYVEGRGKSAEQAVDVDEDFVVELVSGLIARAIEERASDIHIEPKMGDTRVRLRIDGILRDLDKIPATLHNAVISRVKILSTLDIAEKRRPQDGVIFLRYGEKDVDLRVAASPTIYGESITLRVLDQSKAGVQLSDLGFEEGDLEKTLKAIQEPYGFILATGPTGSGKTTTMYAILNRIDSPEKKIVTIEDPVEYRMEGLNQMQINPAIELGFALLLRSVLRQDPNVILVGEIRDDETAHVAVQAALTGHLLLSTLHTTDAPEVLLRLMEIGIEHFYVREVVKLIIAQRLVRRLCVECRTERAATARELEEMGVAATGKASMWDPKGCDACSGTGYMDRTAVYETMPMSEEIKDLIAPDVPLRRIRDKAVEQGMRTLWQNAVGKVLAGNTSLEEIRRTIPR
jgi:type II secretory ATPase GspE/PulE/Tfp pilus assembly ATPase PilB-like protein